MEMKYDYNEILFMILTALTAQCSKIVFLEFNVFPFCNIVQIEDVKNSDFFSKKDHLAIQREWQN